MPSVDVVDETFLAVPPRGSPPSSPSPPAGRGCGPTCACEVVTDRGEQGVRWTVTGALVGSMEVWLEPVLDGTVLHYFLRADPAGPDGAPAPARRAAGDGRGASAAAGGQGHRVRVQGPVGGLGAGAPGEPPERRSARRVRPIAGVHVDVSDVVHGENDACT